MDDNNNDDSNSIASANNRVSISQIFLRHDEFYTTPKEKKLQYRSKIL